MSKIYLNMNWKAEFYWDCGTILWIGQLKLIESTGFDWLISDGRSETAFLLDVGVYINLPTHCAVTVRFGAQSTSHESCEENIFNVAMIANCRETSYAQFTVNDWTLGMVILLKRGAIAGSRTRVDGLEGRHDNRYTTIAQWTRPISASADIQSLWSAFHSLASVLSIWLVIAKSHFSNLTWTL